MSEPTSIRVGPYECAELGNGWTVRRYTGRRAKAKDGTDAGEIIAVVGYYSDLEHSLRSVLREEMRGKGTSDALALLAGIESCYSGIRVAVTRYAVTP